MNTTYYFFPEESPLPSIPHHTPWHIPLHTLLRNVQAPSRYRLRVTVKDPAKVADLAAWKAEGALSLLVKGDGIQAVYGPKADVLKSDINDIL